MTYYPLNKEKFYPKRLSQKTFQLNLPPFNVYILESKLLTNLLIYHGLLRFRFHLLPTADNPTMMEKDGKAHSTKDVASKQPSIKQVLSNFCGYTTAHGLGRLAESRNGIRRIAWSLFCIGALVMFVLQIKNLFLIYLSRPVATVVNVHHESVSMKDKESRLNAINGYG